MAGGFFRITIADKDYESTRYVVRVRAASKNQAIVLGAAMAGGEKVHREWQRTGREPMPEEMTDPDLTAETCSAQEFHEHQAEVEVTTRS